MIRLPKVILALLAIVLLLGLAMPAMAEEAKGKIKSVSADQNQFVMTDADQKDWTIQVNKDSKILLNDKEAKLGDLQAGHEVTVNYTKDGDKFVASEVRCKK